VVPGLQRGLTHHRVLSADSRRHPPSSALYQPKDTYLQRTDAGVGVRVGALSGALAALPFLLFVLFVSGFVFAGPMMGGMGLPGGFAALLFVGLFFALVWSVGLGAIGGYLCVYIREETDIGA
jgi:hypothetical protein